MNVETERRGGYQKKGDVTNSLADMLRRDVPTESDRAVALYNTGVCVGLCCPVLFFGVKNLVYLWKRVPIACV
jgi:hypothetical protein